MDERLGTFNLNNLFDRFNFEADLGTLPAEDATSRRPTRGSHNAPAVWRNVTQGDVDPVVVVGSVAPGGTSWLLAGS